MKPTYTILIADRNKHVRELLKRELMVDGYQVLLAKSAEEMVATVYDVDSLDVLILDPDLPENDSVDMMRRLNDRIPALPTIIHSYGREPRSDCSVYNTIYEVEKGGRSIAQIKVLVAKLCGRYDAASRGITRQPSFGPGGGVKGTCHD